MEIADEFEELISRIGKAKFSEIRSSYKSKRYRKSNPFATRETIGLKKMLNEVHIKTIVKPLKSIFHLSHYHYRKNAPINQISLRFRRSK